MEANMTAMQTARNVERLSTVGRALLGARWAAPPLLIFALLTTQSISQVTEPAANADRASAPQATDSIAPPDCDKWQKANISLPRMAGPFHNHEVEPQIEAEQAKQMAVGVRCLASKLNEMVVLGNSFLAYQRSAPQQALWKQMSEALLAETTSLNALTLRVDSLTAAIKIQLSVPHPDGDPKPPGRGLGPSGKDNFHTELNDLMQAMRIHERQMTELTATIGAALQGATGAGGPSPAVPTPASPSSHPLNIDESLSSQYGHRADSDTAFAIVTIPDPSVPRHRRAYDLGVAALTEGMIRARFVLDDFKFPWDPMPTVAVGD
jgi:hypothetical protein